MSIRVTCPNCKTAAACPDEYQGKSLRCKKCGRPFVARAPAQQAARPRSAEAAVTGRKRSHSLFLVAVLLSALLGVGFALPAYLLLKKEKPSDDLAAGPVATSMEDTRRHGDTPPGAPPGATTREDPPDTGVPPLADPTMGLIWQEFTSPDGRFRVRFPGTPEVTSPPSGSGKRVQMLTASLPRAMGRKGVWFVVTCEDFEGGEASDADGFLAARAAEPGAHWTVKNSLKLGRFPGLELEDQPIDGESKLVGASARRLYLVRTRLYSLTARAPAARDAAPLFQRFFGSFKLLDAADPPGPELLPPPITVAVPPRDGLASLQLNVPAGWTATYNKFLSAWVVKKPSPTPRSDEEQLWIEECPTDAGTPEVYAAHLKEKDFLNGDVPGFVEVGDKGDLPEGFFFKGVVKRYSNPKTPPIVGLLAVREIGGLRVRCYSANLRTTRDRPEGFREELLEMFKEAKFAAAQ